MHKTEKKIVIFLTRLHWAPLDEISEAISNIAVLTALWLVIIASAMLVNVAKGFVIAVELALVFVVHYIISEGIIKYGGKKFSLARKRPYVAYPEEIRGIGKNFSDSSFPSSHMASVTGGLIILWAAFPATWPALLIFGLLLAFSRLHNGMHYPSDILAGIILGIVYGNIVLAVARIIFG